VLLRFDHVASFNETAHNRRVKYWEIIADRLSKAGWSWAGSQPLILRAERSGLWTRIATSVSVLLCAPTKSFVELERQVLTVTFYLESIHAGDQRR
jgi:hypothetical protein